MLALAGFGCGSSRDTLYEAAEAAPPAAEGGVIGSDAAADSAADSRLPGVGEEAAAFHILEITDTANGLVTSPTLLLPNRRIRPIAPGFKCPVTFPANRQTGLDDPYVTPEPYSWMAIRNPFDTDVEVTVFQSKIDGNEVFVYPRFYIYTQNKVSDAMANRLDCLTVGGNEAMSGYELSLTLDRRLHMAKLRLAAHGTVLVYTQFDPPYSRATLLDKTAVNVNVRTDRVVRGGGP